tara:strand:+ start:388 stop:777 length:390 start_codon:yes stop_codon:yes gene_type:complete
MMGPEDPWIMTTESLTYNNETLHDKIVAHAPDHTPSPNDRTFLKECLQHAINIPKGGKKHKEEMLGIIKYLYSNEASNVVSEVLHETSKCVTRGDMRIIDEIMDRVETVKPADFVKNIISLEKKCYDFL